MPSELNRRKFLKVLSGAAAATAVNATALFAAGGTEQRVLGIQEHQPMITGKRIAVLWDDDLLRLSGLTLSRELLEVALRDWKPEFLTPLQVKDSLRVQEVDLFVDPFGPVFPVEAWESIYKYLQDGGHWLHIGGAPFALPAQHVGDSSRALRAEGRTTAFHRKLGITQCFPTVISDSAAKLSTGEFGTLSEWQAAGSGVMVEELYVRLAVKSDVPGEEESEGIRQAILHPLIVIQDGMGKAIAAPVIELERIAGPAAGGRWVLSTFHGTPSSALLKWMAQQSLAEVAQCAITPSLACYHAGERISLDVTIALPGKTVSSTLKAECRVEILDDAGSVAADIPFRLEGKGPAVHTQVEVPAGTGKPGLYRVRGKFVMEGVGAGQTIRPPESGFWLFDESRFLSGPRYGVSRDYFMRDGKAYPVTGTTYMASDTHRHFLLEPNPAGWEDDFTAMKKSGVNMVRTGLWGGWKSIAQDGVHIRESVLRAFEAYVLTARRHDIPVIFTFFAFLPQTWGGENPYLDPDALAAQAGFVGGFAARFARVRGLMWDLINEPSFCSAANLWKCRPNYDRHEVAAWHSWVAGQTVIDRPGGPAIPLVDAWRARNIDPFTLPSLDDFTDTNIIGDLVPAKAAAYRRFAQEAFASWAKSMREVIADRGSKQQLVTVGQDEGGSYERPSPFFYSGSVDFTCDHTWWFNDDLLWDGITSKTPSIPNLIEETGVMFYERADGMPWRTEDEARNLLERKMVMAFAGAGAGFIQWLWNTNVLMPSDNEVAIGFLRADGTAKPELVAFEQFAAGIQEHAKEFADRKQEEVAMMIPYSNLFAVRTLALDTTRRCVRTMEYACDTPMRALSEYRLEDGLGTARLIMVPSAGMISEAAWQQLLSAARQGATVLVTGHLERDEHGRPFPRFAGLGISVEVRPVSSTEELFIDGQAYQATYRGEKLQRVEKGVDRASQSQTVHMIPMGEGRVLWMPLPLEASDDTAPVEALYRFALQQAGIVPSYRRETLDRSVLIRPVRFPNSTMYAIVNESSMDKTIRFTPVESGRVMEVKIEAGRARVVFEERGK